MAAQRLPLSASEVAIPLRDLCMKLPSDLADALWFLADEPDHVLDKAATRRERQRDLLPFPMGAIGYAHELKYYRALSSEVRDQATAWLQLILAVLNSQYSGFKGVAVTMGYGPLTLCQTTSMERLSSVALDFVQREVDPPRAGRLV